MTQRRTSLGRVLLGAAGVWASIGLSGGAAPAAAAAEGPAITIYAVNPADVASFEGRQLLIYMKVASTDPGLTVTVDAKGLARDGFVQRILPSSLYCETRCSPCPTDHTCFQNQGVIFEARLVGHVELPIVVTESNGRSTRVMLPVDVKSAPDQDGDGLPTAFENLYYLNAYQSDFGGPGDDPDGDGLTNLEEYRSGTNPRARYFYYFAEASAGDRAPGLDQCFAVTYLAPSQPRGAGVWVTLVGDDGRRYHGSDYPDCPLSRETHVADRVVAVVFESASPIHIERTVRPPLPPNRFTPSNWIATTAMDAPSTRWFFADGGTDGLLDTFYLFFNPGPKPVDATMTYRRDDGGLILRKVRTLAPGVRTTVWVNADDAALGRTPASVEVTAGAPVLVERAWRFDPRGRTVTQTSSPGIATPSPHWIFPEVDGGADVETTIVVANPSSRAATVDVVLLYEGEAERRVGAVTIRPGGRAAIPARQLDGLAGRRASVELVSRNGAGVVAERILLGHDAYGPWRLASAGATSTGAHWIVPRITYVAEAVFTNPSSTDVTLDLRIQSFGSDESIFTQVTVPARQRRTYRLAHPFHHLLHVTARPTPQGSAEVVVESVRRLEGDGASRPRAVGAIAARLQ